MKRYQVYILASEKYGTLYVGMTGNLPLRIKAHKEHAVQGFTDKYKVDKLVYVEACDNAMQAIELEKRIKKWKRAWKIRIIEAINPEWEDLSEKDGFFL